MTPKYNNLLSEPTLLFVDAKSLLKPSPDGSPNWSGILGLKLDRRHKYATGQSLENVTAGLELYIRRMLEACAHSVRVPAYGGAMWASPRRLKSPLCASSKRRLKFVDRRHSVWTAIYHYLHPVSQEIAETSSQNQIRRPFKISVLEDVAWGLYMLALATRDHCDVRLDPKTVILSIDCIADGPLSSESRTRLSTIRGIFGLFSHVWDVPGFRCIALPGVTLRDRIDDIMEDAYFLEASRLRRFLGVRANVVSVKRDLGKLLRFIVRSRPWAKGVLQAVASAVPLPKTPSEISAKLLDIVPDLQVDGSAPLLVEPNPHGSNMQGHIIVTSRREAFSSSESWDVTILPLGPLGRSTQQQHRARRRKGRRRPSRRGSR